MVNIKRYSKLLLFVYQRKIFFNNVNISPIQRVSKIIHQSNKFYSTNEIIYEKYKISKENCIDALRSLLGIDNELALKIVKDNKELSRTPPHLIKENYDVCKIYKVTKKSILDHPYILSHTDLPEKLHLLNATGDNVNKMVHLLTNNLETITRMVGLLENGGSRAAYIAKLLNVTPIEIMECMEKKPFLRKLNLKKAAESIELLKDNGVTDQEIMNDLWALNYKKSTMEKRIAIVKANNLDKIKTWMIRVPPNTLLNHIRIRSDNKLILGNNSLTEYLSQKLKCSIDEANYIVTKLPALKAKSVKKIDEIITYLYEFQIKPIQICVSPKILLHSVDTVKKRVKELQKEGVHIDNLNILLKTQKKYAVYYNKLVSTNKKKLRSIK